MCFTFEYFLSRLCDGIRTAFVFIRHPIVCCRYLKRLAAKAMTFRLGDQSDDEDEWTDDEEVPIPVF